MQTQETGASCVPGDQPSTSSGYSNLMYTNPSCYLAEDDENDKRWPFKSERDPFWSSVNEISENAMGPRNMDQSQLPIPGERDVVTARTNDNNINTLADAPHREPSFSTASNVETTMQQATKKITMESQTERLV